MFSVSELLTGDPERAAVNNPHPRSWVSDSVPKHLCAENADSLIRLWFTYLSQPGMLSGLGVRLMHMESDFATSLSFFLI